MLPQDPVMLLSYINTQLRDNYDSIESLAEGLDIPESDLENIKRKLEAIGYRYDKAANQFK
jgi:biotin operon repressor